MKENDELCTMTGRERMKEVWEDMGWGWGGGWGGAKTN